MHIYTRTFTSILYRYEQYVEQAYVEYLKEQNRPDEVHIVHVYLVFHACIHTLYVHVYTYVLFMDLIQYSLVRVAIYTV